MPLGQKKNQALSIQPEPEEEPKAGSPVLQELINTDQIPNSDRVIRAIQDKKISVEEVMTRYTKVKAARTQNVNVVSETQVNPI